MELKIYPSARMLRAIADVMDAEKAENNAAANVAIIGKQSTFGAIAKSVGFKPTEPFTGVADVYETINNDTAVNATTREEAGAVYQHSGPPRTINDGDTVQIVQSSTTQDNPMGNEVSAFAAPKKRGRPPKNPATSVTVGGQAAVVTDQTATTVVATLPLPVPQLEIPTPGANVTKHMATPETKVSESAVEIVGTAVASTVTPEDTIKAYFDRFKVAGFRALLNRENVAKFGELSDERRTVCLAEMRDALEMDVPVVAS